MIAKYHIPLLFYLFLCAGDVAAQSPVEAPSAEMAAVGNWADVAFGQPLLIPSGGEARDGLTVLRQSHKVLVNRTAWDTPITLGDKQFAHGVYMDAPAALLVRLAQPAEEFTAQVGIDNNADTRAAPTTSSARFHVVVGGKRVFSSPVRKLRDGALAIRVPLDGAREFVLETDDGGDGRSHDQCVWADAAVKFADGSSSSSTACRSSPDTPNRSNVPFSFLYGGQPSDALLPDWQYAQKSEPSPAARGRRSRTAIPRRGFSWRSR